MVKHRILSLCLCVACVLSISACSDVQNREKKKTEKVNGAAISVEVVARTTTKGTTTTKDIDSKIENTVRKNLVQALVKGAVDKDLFSASALVHAGEEFPDNTSAKKNTVKVTYDLLASDNKDEEVVVTEITQSVVPKSGEKITRSGRIFFDIQGNILGYSFDDVTGSQTTTTGVTS